MASSTNVDPALFKSPPRKSTVDMVMEKIRELLLAGKLKPGDRLPNEMELTSRLGASRGSVREAMKILSSFGVLEIRRGDGTYVSRSMSNHLFDHLLFQLIVSDSDMRQLIELRQLMEYGIIQQVIQNATEEDIARIEHCNIAMEENLRNGVRDSKVFIELDIGFHLALGNATHNELIEKIYAFTMELFTSSIEKTHSDPDAAGKRALRLHRNISDAIRKRDSEAAQKAVEASLEIWADIIRNVS